MKNSSYRPIVPGGLVVFLLFAYGLAELLPVLMAEAFRMPWNFFYQLPQTQLFRTLAIGLTAMFYGFSRVGRFHPSTSAGYRAWLATTPWTSDQPLPFGPVLPVWRDAVVLATLAALMAWRGGLPFASPIIIAAMAYTLDAGLTVARGGARAWAIALLWVAPLLTFVTSFTWALAVTAVLLTLACLGLRRSLHELSRMKKVMPPARGELGWPFRRLAPDAPGITPRGRGTWVAALVGWWIAAVGRLCLLGKPAPEWGATLFFIGLVAGVIALVRFGIYAEGHAKPFKRLSTGRLIIPGYDQIWLAPACAMAGGVAVAAGLLMAGASANVAFAGGVAVALAAAIEMGPTLRAWRLTGHHRVTAPVSSTRNAR